MYLQRGLHEIMIYTSQTLQKVHDTKFNVRFELCTYQTIISEISVCDVVNVFLYNFDEMIFHNIHFLLWFTQVPPHV